MNSDNLTRRERLFIIHGMGPDALGLVGSITREIAEYKGNIVDLHQDVLHGLFIIYLVVDLSESTLRLDELHQIISRLSEDTGITLKVDTYNPVPRNPEKKNMLCILSGNDATGLIASISQLFGNYGVNIEFARTIGREGIFLMELMTEISNCIIPIENLITTVRNTMTNRGIKTLFQINNVFNKKKRVILFDSSLNMVDEQQRSELVKQAELNDDDLKTLLHSRRSGQAVAERLEGISLAVYDAIISNIHVTSGSIELLQTLKIMGYTIGLITTASDLFVRKLIGKTGIDYGFGIPYEIDNDTQVFSGLLDNSFSGINRQEIITSIIATEKIDLDDITVINTGNSTELFGIHPVFDMSTILNLYNHHSMSKHQLTAIIASFGLQDATLPQTGS